MSTVTYHPNSEQLVMDFFLLSLSLCPFPLPGLRQRRRDRPIAGYESGVDEPRVRMTGSGPSVSPTRPPGAVRPAAGALKCGPRCPRVAVVLETQ